MPHRTRRTLAAALLASVGTVGVLAGCARGSAADDAVPAPVSPTESSTAPAAPGVDDGAPLGLSVRYVDENGRFVTLTPEDFPR